MCTSLLFRNYTLFKVQLLHFSVLLNVSRRIGGQQICIPLQFTLASTPPPKLRSIFPSIVAVYIGGACIGGTESRSFAIRRSTARPVTESVINGFRTQDTESGGRSIPPMSVRSRYIWASDCSSILWRRDFQTFTRRKGLGSGVCHRRFWRVGEPLMTSWNAYVSVSELGDMESAGWKMNGPCTFCRR